MYTYNVRKKPLNTTQNQMISFETKLHRRKSSPHYHLQQSNNDQNLHVLRPNIENFTRNTSDISVE
ncbi:hypothetical protein V6Z11_D08G084500 [Gossypium hirsutum]